MELIKRSTVFQSDGKTLIGLIPYNSQTNIIENGKRFAEVISPTAFRKSLSDSQDIIATYNHDPSKLLARTSAGTLRLNHSDSGLRFEIDLPDTATGQEVATLTRTGNLQGASFTFAVRAGGEKWAGNTRTLTDIHLVEIGPVTLPAYPASTIGLRSNRLLNEMYLKIAECN